MKANNFRFVRSLSVLASVISLGAIAAPAGLTQTTPGSTPNTPSGAPESSPPVTQPPTSQSPTTGTPGTGTTDTQTPGTGTTDTQTPSTQTPATGTPATGTPATGTPATGTPATGTPATGTPATGTPATGTPATGTPATGTPATGTPSTQTPTVPPSAQNQPLTQVLQEVSNSSGSFRTLAQAVEAAGLSGALQERGGRYTVFAPTDEAFNALPAGTLDRLLQPENRELLRQVLAYHVVPEELSSDELTTGALPTLNGGLAVRVTPERVVINDGSVVRPDIQTANGIVHVVSRVLIPADLQQQLDNLQ
jgi:uncharacterized surface protein with fasciclin (FAS1) repeats